MESSTKDTEDQRKLGDELLHPPCRSGYSYGPGEARKRPLAASPVHSAALVATPALGSQPVRILRGTRHSFLTVMNGLPSEVPMLYKTPPGMPLSTGPGCLHVITGRSHTPQSPPHLQCHSCQNFNQGVQDGLLILRCRLQSPVSAIGHSSLIDAGETPK